MERVEVSGVLLSRLLDRGWSRGNLRPLSYIEERRTYREVLENGVNREELDILKKLLDRGCNYDGRIYLFGFRNLSYSDKGCRESRVLVKYAILRFNPNKKLLQYIDLESLQEIIMDRIESIRSDDLWIRIYGG